METIIAVVIIFIIIFCCVTTYKKRAAIAKWFEEPDYNIQRIKKLKRRIKDMQDEIAEIEQKGRDDK